MSAIDIFSESGDPSLGSQPAMLTPAQIVAMLWAYRYVLVIVPLIAAVLAGVTVKFFIDKTYQARTTLLVSYGGNDAVDAGVVDSWGFVSTQIELMRSPITLEPVVDRLDLVDNPDFLIGYSGDGSDASLRRHAASLVGLRIDAWPGSASRVIYLFARDKNPQLAADIANAVAESYVEIQLNQFIDPARQRIERYGPQLATLRANVESAQAKVAEYREKTGLIDMREGADSDTDRLRSLENRLSEVAQNRREASLRLGRIRNADPSVIQSGLAQGLRGQLRQKESRRAELAESLGPRHPDMVALDAEITELTAQLQREVDVEAAAMQVQVDFLASQEADLRQRVTAQRNRTLEVRKQQDEGARLLQALDSATKVYQAALDSFERAQFGTQMAANKVNIIDHATPPARHMSGGRKKVIFAVGLAGLLTGAGCLLYEFLHRRVRCRDDLEKTLGVPVLVHFRPA